MNKSINIPMAKGKAEKAMGIPRGTTNHELIDLVGRKIKNIYLHEVDVAGDGTNVRQFYRIVCSDAQEFILACDGGNEDKQHATASLMDSDDFETFLEDVQSNSEYDEEEDPFNEDEDIDDLFENDHEEDEYS